MILGSDTIDWSGVWTFFLALVRISGLLTTLPGIGTDQVPVTYRLSISVVFALAVAMSGYHAPIIEGLIMGAFVILMEYMLGYIMGMIPQFIIAALSVAGQAAASTMGIAQASLIDPSIGVSVSVLAKLQSLIATVLFLLVDGHHLIFRAATGVSHNLALGEFVFTDSVTTFMIEKFSSTFEFGILVTSPILVAILVTQFLLGLVTRFVPQINVFIISLPLTIGIGLYITAFTLSELSEHLTQQYLSFEEDAVSIFKLGLAKENYSPTPQGSTPP